jgi:hypothetical protein
MVACLAYATIRACKALLRNISLYREQRGLERLAGANLFIAV